jgi:hypothetical protein
MFRPSTLKNVLKKLFARSVSPRPTTIRKAARLGCEVFESRVVPAVGD